MCETRTKLEQQMREAIEFHIEGLRQNGEQVSESSTEAGLVEVAG